MIKTAKEKYKSDVRKHLSDARYYHSLCVAEEAKKLAEKYGADPEKAEIAGILHDVAKEIPYDKQEKMLEKYDVNLTEFEKKKPKLWHAVLAAEYVKNELGVEDEEILGAIRWHTTGRKDMTLLEKILFIADFNSADRTYEGVEDMRKLADKSLELAMIEGITFTANEQFENHFLIGADMIDAYNDAIETIYGNDTQ